MSTISNALLKIVDNSAELFSLFQCMGIDTSSLEIDSSKAKIQAEKDKLCKKRWRHRNPEKLKIYWQKFYYSDKGKAYRERTEYRELQRVYNANYYQRNKERLKLKSRLQYAKKKAERNAASTST